MMGNTAYFSRDDWENDIGLAQEAHIDAFALNIAYGDPDNAGSIANAFAAANSRGFKLFFSFDYAGNGSWPQADVLSLLNEYASNSAYWHRVDQPLVSTFEGPDSSDDWSDIKTQTNCFFIPSWSSLGAKMAMEKGVADGLFSWGAWPEGPNDMFTNTDASYEEFLNQKPYMMPVAPWFFTNMRGYRKNWLWRGDDLWFDRWNHVLFHQPEFVEIITWNDYGESHYIGPLHDTQYEVFSVGKSPYNYALNMPHDGWRLFLPYLIDTYKYNISSFDHEGLVSWYRPQPASACATGGTTGNTASQLQTVYPPSEIVQDKVFFSAMLASSAEVVVTIGDSSQTATWENVPDGGIGIYHGSVSFNGNVGSVTVTLSRSGTTIAEISGLSITTNCTKGIENWNAWVGSASASNTISSTSPPRSIDEQVCIGGTGPDNYADLCSFACKYGYCPSVCTCSAMGAQKKLPDVTGDNGCPADGLDATFLGLCKFSCNYGHCPSNVCTIYQSDHVCTAPDPVAPPTPVCVAGEGLDGCINTHYVGAGAILGGS